MRACDYPINNHIDTQQNTLNTNSSKFESAQFQIESAQFQIGYKQFQIESAHSSRWRYLRWNIRNSRRSFQQSWALCKYWIFPKVSCTRDIFTRSSSLRLLDMACVSWNKNEHVCNVFASTNLMKWNEEISKRWRPRVWLPCFEKPLMPKACADKIYLFKGMCWTTLSIFPRHQLNVLAFLKASAKKQYFQRQAVKKWAIFGGKWSMVGPSHHHCL